MLVKSFNQVVQIHEHFTCERFLACHRCKLSRPVSDDPLSIRARTPPMIQGITARNGCSLGPFRPARIRLQSTVKIVVADDYEVWRRFVASALEKRPEFRIVGEAADGLEAVQRVQELQPDLILLDIGLPKRNGLEAARRIRDCSPNTRIIFLSQNRSAEIAQEALRIGDGYVVKSGAARELLSAVEAVLQGKQFLSASLSADEPPGNP